MSVFGDQMLLRFLEDDFVNDFLTNKIGLPAIFSAGYALTDLELQDLMLASVNRKIFSAPTFETIRVTGSQERITPSSERSQMDRQMKRYGRTVWADVQLDLSLGTKVHVTASSIDSIRSADLIDDLGGVITLADLRTKLALRYAPSVIDGMFKTLRITTIADFKERMNVLLHILFNAPPPFDPADPGNARVFPLSVCVKFEPDLSILDALQGAKLCRSVMEKEMDFKPSVDGAEVITPYVMVIVYPDSVVKDGAIPGLTAAQIRTGVQAVFAAEGMAANFFVGA